MTAITLILGGAIAGSIVTLLVVGALSRIERLLPPKAGADKAPQEPPPATAPFSASPPRLADVPSGRHASGAPSPTRRTAGPESDVERTHLMAPVRPRPAPTDNPTGIDGTMLAAALSRGVTRPSPAGAPYRMGRRESSGR